MAEGGIPQTDTIVAKVVVVVADSKDEAALRAAQSAKDTQKQRKRDASSKQQESQSPGKASAESVAPEEAPAPEPRRYGRG